MQNDGSKAAAVIASIFVVFLTSKALGTSDLLAGVLTVAITALVAWWAFR